MRAVRVSVRGLLVLASATLQGGRSLEGPGLEGEGLLSVGPENMEMLGRTRL